MKKLIICTLLCLISAITGAFLHNKCTTYDKKSFSSIEEERDFLVEANDIKFELILMYDGAINATDSTEKQYYLSRIDSLYDLEY